MKRRLDLETCTFTVAQRKRVGNRLTNRPLIAPVVEEIKGESISDCISCEL